jgi:hypothetical protein
VRELYLGLALLLLTGCAATRPGLGVESPYVDPRTLQVGQVLHLATGRLLAESEALDYLCRFPWCTSASSTTMSRRTRSS